MLQSGRCLQSGEQRRSERTYGALEGVAGTHLPAVGKACYAAGLEGAAALQGVAVQGWLQRARGCTVFSRDHCNHREQREQSPLSPTGRSLMFRELRSLSRGAAIRRPARGRAVVGSEALALS